MPVYEHWCKQCGSMELARSMKAPTPTRCPGCGLDGLERRYSSTIIPPCDSGQERENNGLGRFYPQLGTEFIDQKTKRHRNPASHATSRDNAMEKFKRRGAQVEKA